MGTTILVAALVLYAALVVRAFLRDRRAGISNMSGLSYGSYAYVSFTILFFSGIGGLLIGLRLFGTPGAQGSISNQDPRILIPMVASVVIFYGGFIVLCGPHESKPAESPKKHE
jgi:hypothetical protein